MDPKLKDFSDISDPKLEGMTEIDVTSAPAEAYNSLKQQDLSGNEKELLVDDHGRQIPPWYHQVTFRALFVGAAISVLFCIMVLK